MWQIIIIKIKINKLSILEGLFNLKMSNKIMSNWINN